jgi:hypothetical protein
VIFKADSCNPLYFIEGNGKILEWSVQRYRGVRNDKSFGGCLGGFQTSDDFKIVSGDSDVVVSNHLVFDVPLSILFHCR